MSDLERGLDPLATDGEPTGFHLKDGLFFRRNEDGSIAIERWDLHDRWHLGKPVRGWYRKFSVTTDESGMASVMASVSARGENGDTYQEALDYLSRIPALEALEAAHSLRTLLRIRRAFKQSPKFLEVPHDPS